MAEPITKPGVEETSTSFRFRVRDPDAFQEGSFRTAPFKRSSPKINAVYGRLKGETTSTLQSLIFPKDEGWTRAKVSEWVAAHREDLKRDYGVEASKGDFEDEKDWAEAPDAGELGDLIAYQAKAPASGVIIRKTFGAEIKAVHADDFSADIVISTAELDRDHEVVEPGGMIVKDAVLPLVGGHFLGNLQNQIGTLKKPRHTGATLVATPMWLVARGNPQADWAWVLVTEGVAKFSIGFLPMEHEDADLGDEKVVARIRAGKEPLRRHTKWELVEVSQVIVPSNRGAVQRMADVGILVGEFAEAAAKAAQEGDISEKAQTLFDQALESFKALAAKTPDLPLAPALVIPAQIPEPVVELKGEEDILQLLEEAVKPEDIKKPEHQCPAGHHWNGTECVKDKPKDAAASEIVEVKFDTDALQSVLTEWATYFAAQIGRTVEEALENAGLKALKEELKADILESLDAKFITPDDAHKINGSLTTALMAAIIAEVDKRIARAQGDVDQYRL